MHVATEHVSLNRQIANRNRQPTNRPSLNPRNSLFFFCCAKTIRVKRREVLCPGELCPFATVPLTIAFENASIKTYSCSQQTIMYSLIKSRECHLRTYSETALAHSSHIMPRQHQR